MKDRFSRIMRKYVLILMFDAFITFLLTMIFILNKENLYNYIFLFLFNVFTIIPLFYFILSFMDSFFKQEDKILFHKLNNACCDISNFLDNRIYSQRQRISGFFKFFCIISQQLLQSNFNYYRLRHFNVL